MEERQHFLEGLQFLDTFGVVLQPQAVSQRSQGWGLCLSLAGVISEWLQWELWTLLHPSGSHPPSSMCLAAMGPLSRLHMGSSSLDVLLTRLTGNEMQD